MPHEYSDESSSDDDGVAPTQTTRHRGGGGTSSSNHHRQRSTSSQAESDNDHFEVVVERRVTNGTEGGRYYRESRRRTSAPRDGDDDLDDSETRRRSSIGDSHRIEGGSSSGARTPDSSFLRDLETSSAAASGRIGDSRSIVLALRALQDKIRKLEADRDFHREQCEAARRAHEAYKHEVETRLERDRADFRQREQELQSLIARAKQEHSRLLRTLDDSKADLGSASSEMTTLIERERIDTAAREARLREELDSFRRQIAEERLAKEQLVQQLEQARAERGIVETTNRRLEHTMKDLLSMNEKLVVQQQQRQTQARHVDATADSIQQRSAGVRRSASTDAAAARLRQPPMRFQSPTLSSLQHRSASANPRPDGLEADTSNPRISPPRTRLAPPSVASRPVALHRETRDVYRASYRSTSGVPLARQHAAPHISGESAAAAAQPLDDVYAALEKELRDLNRQYRSVIAEANDPDSHMSHELLTAKLNGIMVQIDRKTEQMRLLRVTKADVTKEDVRTRPHVAKGYVKSTVKANTTNNLRAMAAGSR